MKVNYIDLLNFFIFDNDIVFKYDKKLVMVRFLVVNMIEFGENEINSYCIEWLMFWEEWCRIILDYINDFYLIVLFFNDVISVYICYLIEFNSSYFVMMKGIIFFK